MDHTLHAIPNACAALALTQFRKLREINDHRRMLTKFYLQAFKDRGWRVLEGITEDLPLQKFPFFPSPIGTPPIGRGLRGGAPLLRPPPMGEVPAPDAHHLRSLLKRRNIHLDDGWTGCVICPATVDPSDTDYTPGSDHGAEHVAASILSLPTHPTMTEKQSKNLCTLLAHLLQ